MKTEKTTFATNSRIQDHVNSNKATIDKRKFINISVLRIGFVAEHDQSSKAEVNISKNIWLHAKSEQLTPKTHKVIAI